MKKRQNEKVGYLFKKKYLIEDESIEIDGGKWCHVRHLPKGSKWYKATDKLAGTDEYGKYGEEDEEWSIKFDNIHYNQFLFATGDLKKWMIAGKEAVNGSFYDNRVKTIQKSSDNDEPHKARWYRTNYNKFV